jgi:hypothetical protein
VLGAVACRDHDLSLAAFVWSLSLADDEVMAAGVVARLDRTIRPVAGEEFDLALD